MNIIKNNIQQYLRTEQAAVALDGDAGLPPSLYCFNPIEIWGFLLIRHKGRGRTSMNWYKRLGISEAVYNMGEECEKELAARFAAIDKRAEENQLKVLAAFQKNRVSAECFSGTTGYGYNDTGRDTLEAVYADTFGTEAALVRPQIACGTHALSLALAGNTRPGDEILSQRCSKGILRQSAVVF